MENTFQDYNASLCHTSVAQKWAPGTERKFDKFNSSITCRCELNIGTVNSTIITVNHLSYTIILLNDFIL